MVLGEKDVFVNNVSAKDWHAKTASKIKTLRLMAGAYHELTKEPNNNVLFEASLKFMGDRLVASGTDSATQSFGIFKHESVRYYKPRSLLQRKKFWLYILVVTYFVIGFLLALNRKRKMLLLTWPKSLF